MTTPSYARLLLEHWGIGVADIPTSDKEEADFLATFGSAKVLIEEKTKLDDPAQLAERAKVLDAGEIHAASVPLLRDNRLSGIVSKAARQRHSGVMSPAGDTLLAASRASQAAHTALNAPRISLKACELFPLYCQQAEGVHR
ncbi:MAG: hypothetical protein JSR59_06460 [Proteobacteria bacterium]|nr:hypothetical protein [Pseudomonadota bacterium]